MAGQGTVPEGINAGGVTIGNYIDESGVNHGFIRAADGNVTEFDVPGAGTGSGQGTIPLTNNPAGVITGIYVNNTGAIHGFMRIP